MKKMLCLIFALLSLFQTGAAQVSPHNRLSVDLSGQFQGVYRPGIYLAAEMGYAAIQAPKHGVLDSESGSISGKNGHFAYGLFVGFNGYTCYDRFYFGFEGGYHNNGYTHFLFHKSGNQLQLESYDWGGSATFTYAFWRSADIFVKVGAARVTERIRNKDADLIMPNLRGSEWAPTVDTGIGYSVWDWLNLSVSYRGVFARNQSDLKSRLKIREIRGQKHYDWIGISTVHAVYGGLNFIF